MVKKENERDLASLILDAKTIQVIQSRNEQKWEAATCSGESLSVAREYFFLLSESTTAATLQTWLTCYLDSSSLKGIHCNVWKECWQELEDIKGMTNGDKRTRRQYSINFPIKQTQPHHRYDGFKTVIRWLNRYLQVSLYIGIYIYICICCV